MSDGPLPPVPAALADAIADLLEVDRFLLFGGAALDLLTDPGAAVHDVDVALDASHPMDATVDRLVAKGLRAGPLREHHINWDEPVWMLDLAWGNCVIDLNFVQRADRIGQFDLETLLWRWPERDIVDSHGARDALRRRTVRLVRPIDGEDPLLLLARLLKLTAKYDLRLTDAAHRPIVAALDAALDKRAIAPEESADVATAQAAVLSRCRARARDPRVFLHEISASGLLRHLAQQPAPVALPDVQVGPR